MVTLQLKYILIQPDFMFTLFVQQYLSPTIISYITKIELDLLTAGDNSYKEKFNVIILSPNEHFFINSTLYSLFIV
mgnify:CR=1 FL=1